MVKQIIHNNDAKSNHLNGVVQYVNALNFFIIYSILDHEKIEEKEYVFNFWFNIFSCSMNLEDLFSAFVIGEALRSSTIKNVLPNTIKENRYEKLKIVEPNKNFLKYRKREKVKSKTVSLSIAFNDIERAYHGLKSLDEFYSDSFDFFIEKRSIFRAIYKESNRKHFNSNQEILSLLENLTSFITEEIIASSKIFDAVKRIISLRAGAIFKNYEIEKNILNWEIENIESFLAKMEIEREEKIEVLSSIVNKYYIVDGISLGNFIINEWPHKKDIEKNQNVVLFYDNILNDGFIHFIPAMENLNEQDALRFLKEYSQIIHLMAS